MANLDVVEVSGIKLVREDVDAVVYGEINGVWVELIREELDARFSHIVEPSGMRKALEDKLST